MFRLFHIHSIVSSSILPLLLVETLLRRLGGNRRTRQLFITFIDKQLNPPSTFVILLLPSPVLSQRLSSKYAPQPLHSTQSLTSLTGKRVRGRKRRRPVFRASLTDDNCLLRDQQLLVRSSLSTDHNGSILISRHFEHFLK